MQSTVRLAIAAGALAAGLYQAFQPTFDSGFARAQTDCGDGMLNHYLLENAWRAVSDSHYCGSLFSPPSFFPERNTVFYTEHLFGVFPLYAALRMALPADLAFQWWQIILAALDFIAFAVVARWLGVSFPLSLLGAYLWAFALVHLFQLRHQQMLPRFWMPPAAYYAWMFASVPSARVLNRLLACVFLQCTCCMNTSWFLVGGLAVFLPTAAAVRPGGTREIAAFARANRTRVALIASGWAILGLAAFAPYLVVNQDVRREYRECFGMIPTPSAWFAGPPGSRWDQTLAALRGTVYEECYLFCGFGFYILATIALAHSWRMIRRPPCPPTYFLSFAALFTALTLVVLTLTPHHAGPSLWAWARVLPGASAIRCVARVHVAVYLFATLGGVVWLNAATGALRPSWRWLIQGLAAAAIVFEQTGYPMESFDKADFYPLASRAAAQLQGADAGYVVRQFSDSEGEPIAPTEGEVLAMWTGMLANVPVVNGYSGRWPPGDHPRGKIAGDEQLRAWLNGRFRGKLTIVYPDHPEARRVIEIE